MQCNSSVKYRSKQKSILLFYFKLHVNIFNRISKSTYPVYPILSFYNCNVCWSIIDTENGCHLLLESYSSYLFKKRLFLLFCL